MIQYKKGDLLKAFASKEVGVILHQENTEGLRRFSGIAKQIHDSYRGLTTKHVLVCQRPDVFGSIVVHKVEEGTIINLYSQKYRGAPSKRDTFEERIEALKSCLNKVKQVVSKEDKLGFPLIASGLASDKNRKGNLSDLEYFEKYIASIIEECIAGYDVTIYYL